MRWVRWAGAGVLLVVAVAALGVGTYRSLVLPRTEGTIRLAGLAGPVQIERDADGIPTIRAGSANDAAFALGFVHAQDRLWQLETHRRIGAGRLAEAFGEPALGTDRFLRALGVRRAAAAQWARLEPRSREWLQAYAEGVNSFLRDELRARPPEFLLLGLQPEPWTPQDSLAWLIMMAWDLGGNWTTELQRMRLALRLPVERINELLPPYPGEKPRVTADYAALFHSLKVDGKLGAQALAAAPESGIEGVGSNNWVLAGSRTASGKPLLANDPHLKLSAPALWYFARIETPQGRVAGATMPGLPSVVLGQNDHLAWGFTNTGPDVQDLYLERIRPGESGQYQTPQGWESFETFAETIKVKGKPDVSFTARATRHGPVISDGGAAEGLTGPAAAPSYAIAMRWTALDADAGTLEASWEMTSARSVDEFVRATARYVAPMQNMVVADRAGRIAVVSAGRVPLRKPENELKGQVPSPGWEPRYDWVGFLDPTATPREADPARGWIATANQRIHAPDYPHYIGSDWAPPWRMQRIEQMLMAKDRHSIDDMRRMQADELSLATVHLLPLLRQAAPSHPLAAAAKRELEGFDGRMAGDRAAPLIFWAWARHLAQGLFADDAGEAVWNASPRAWREGLQGVMERADAWWCDDKTTPAAETCAQQNDAALARALDELQAAQGPDVAAWRWDRAHQARSEHRPFSKVKALARWFELRAPVGGDTYTLNVSRVTLKPDATTGELYLDEHGPSLRAIYDLGEPANSRFMHSSGQSGIVVSPHYRSFVERWAQVDYVPVWMAPAQQTLVLQPR
ncbi:MAG: penicillin acylase family protein [Piscinibacter sp.]|uniref:penicillin acylase family protein n=1 Tax=Piscinibacter sp. TaxID=1903157 RepID=UPI003D12C748